MNLVGKIFTVLIFVMCVVFSSFALMLHAGHKNWRDEFVKQTAQLDKANEENAKLQQAYKLLDDHRKNEKDTLEKKNAELEAKNVGLVAQMQIAANKNNQMEGMLRQFATDFKLVQQNLADIRSEAESLREQNTVAVNERQKMFDNLVKATTDVTNLGADIARLEKLGRDVAAQAAKYHGLLEKAKIRESDIENDPPPVSGLVTGVRQSDVEISLGYDDGIRPGHHFAVTRPSTGNYVGDIVVKQVPYPNRAVGSAVKETMRDQIQKYDHVQANLTKRPEISRGGR